MDNIARLYNFNGTVALSVGDGSTTYLTLAQAQILKDHLNTIIDGMVNHAETGTLEVPASCEQIQKMHEDAPAIYKIIRAYKTGSMRSRTIKKGLTIYEAQAHCADPKTSTAEYFDGYDLM